MFLDQIVRELGQLIGGCRGNVSKAEICVASLKGHGDANQVSRGRLTYDSAKTHFEGVIEGVIVALSGAGDPHSLPSLQVELESGASELAAFCKTVDEVKAVE